MKSHVLAAVDDMIFAAKIRATAEQLGVNVEFPRTDPRRSTSTWAGRPREAACGPSRASVRG